jgi:hypothetical protein
MKKRVLDEVVEVGLLIKRSDTHHAYDWRRMIEKLFYLGQSLVISETETKKLYVVHR